MAKGDDSRARNQITAQGGLAQNNLNNLRSDTIIPQNQTMWNNYQNAVNQGWGDYNGMMQGYQQYLRDNPYGEFMKNGGIGASDAADLRARAIAPTRAIYANAQNEINRNARLNPVSAVNKNAALAQAARGMSSGMSDAVTNANADLAQMRLQGKEFGTSGEVNRALAIRDAMSKLYGTTPGMVNTFGNQVLQSTNQQLDLAKLQNELGLGIMGAQNQASQIPGKMDKSLGWASDISKIIRNVNPYSGGQ